MKNYILFDLDGTLTDPKIGITTCVQYALKAFDIEEPDLDKLEPFIGPPLKDSFMEFYGFGEEQAETAVEKYRERFKDIGIFENVVYDGVPELLKDLKSKGMHLAVASSKPEVFVKRILEHFHIDSYFEVVVGSELDGTRVNKDEVVNEALNRLFKYKPIRREQVYMVGDRKFDVEGAKAMGIESVAVAYGYGDVEELKEAKADYIIRNVDELHNFLLRDIKEEESKPENRGTPTQKIWAIAYPFLMFMAVRLIAVNVFSTIIGTIATAFADKKSNAFIDWMIVYGDNGEIAYTGNIGTVITALSFIAGAVAILPRAKMLISRTYDDTKLSHLKREPWYIYVLAGCATVGIVIGLNLLFSLVGLSDMSASYKEVAQNQYSASFIVGIICYGLITPMAEELLFRGIIYNYLRRFVNIKLAIVISAFLFAGYHMNSVQGIYAFFVGCVMAYAYEYFGSFKVAVCMHMAANIIAYVITYTVLASTAFVSWPVCIIFLAIFLVSIEVMNKRKRIL